MTTLYERLNLDLDTALFGAAANLSSDAANSLIFIADNTPPMPQWQKDAVTNGGEVPIVRTTYFQNPMANSLANISASALSIYNTAELLGDTSTSYLASGLMVNANTFTQHTNNISGVSIVTDANVPSYDLASAVGQQIMMILAKVDGNTSVQNTSPILGSFTSLFISDDIQANANALYFFATEYSSSVTGGGESGPAYVSTLDPSELSNIRNYIANTSSSMNTRETFDKDYYVNVRQIIQDYSFMQQFNNMGGTNTYLTTNMIGTPELANNLTSNS